jgi:hypothetical protein
MESFKRLLLKLPYEYLRCKSFSDFWRSCNCILSATHKKVGKETGEIARGPPVMLKDLIMDRRGGLWGQVSQR